MAKSKSLGGRLGASLPSPSDPKPEDPVDNYEVQGHLRTLMDAEAIKRDPEKMGKVHKLAGRHSKQIKSIQDLKDMYDAKFGKYGTQKPDADDGT